MNQTVRCIIFRLTFANEIFTGLSVDGHDAPVWIRTRKGFMSTINNKSFDDFPFETDLNKFELVYRIAVSFSTNDETDVHTIVVR